MCLEVWVTWVSMGSTKEGDRIRDMLREELDLQLVR
jgi:hypothetical protein